MSNKSTSIVLSAERIIIFITPAIKEGISGVAGAEIDREIQGAGYAN
jgi:hypothetical protein